MTVLIGDLVEACSTEEFRSDVQLSHYRSEHNLALAGDFIFTRRASANRYSSVDLLQKVVDSLQSSAKDNRFCINATFGHGKSHFALAMANFFGERSDSPGCQAVVANLEHAVVDDKPLLGVFQGYKANHKPCLVLVLKGDELTDLQTKFFRAVDEALGAAGLVDKVSPPFWYEGAHNFITAIEPGLREKADQFLAGYDLDLNLLLDKVEQRETVAGIRAAELCRHLYRVDADFEKASGLAAALDWLISELCGENGQFSSVVVLFDEFGAFIRDYSVTILERAGAPLQDLLNGVAKHRGKAVFVGFSQRDPEIYVKTVLDNDSASQNLMTKELERIPKSGRLHLQSSLEDVLDAYLKQDGTGWSALRHDQSFMGQVGAASDEAFDFFARRYGDDLKWDLEHFQETVALGCYPLHPMSTALLCSVELEETGAAARTVLGFVLRELAALRNEEPLRDGKVSWVLPTRLVDFYRSMLGADLWQEYEAAKEIGGGPDIPDSHLQVLKAMLLQRSGGVPSRGRFDRLIAALAGLEVTDATAVLRELSNNGVIRQDQANRTYGFWAIGVGVDQVKKAVAKKLEGFVLSQSALELAEAQLGELMPPMQVPVPWGHKEDWTAKQILLCPGALRPEKIRDIAKLHLNWKMGGKENHRALVIWVVARDDKEVASAQAEASLALAEAFPDSPPPIVVLCSAEPDRDLVDLLLRVYAVSQFKPQEIADLGHQPWITFQSNLREQLKLSLGGFSARAVRDVHPAFRAQIQASGPMGLGSLLQEVVRMAYPGSPKEWFVQYKALQAKLRTDSAALSRHLCSNDVGSDSALEGHPIAKDAASQFLKGKWGVLGHDLRITVPSDFSPVWRAWQTIDQGFQTDRGAISVKSVIDPILNVPYGYDWNTAALLLSAWIGCNRADIELTRSQRPVSVTDLLVDSGGGFKSTKEFLNALTDVALQRRDPGATEKAVKEVLETLDKGKFTLAESETARNLLEEYLRRDDVNLPKQIYEALETLKSQYTKAVTYDNLATMILRKLDGERDAAQLASLLSLVQKLPMPGCVLPARPAASQIKTLVSARAQTITSEKCRSLTDLSDEKCYEQQKQQLVALEKALKLMDLQELVGQTQDAREKLDLALEDLQRKKRDQNNLVVLDALSATGTLAELRPRLEAIDAMDFVTEEAARKAAVKRERVKAEVQRLVSLVSDLPTRVDGASSDHELRTVEGQILENKWAFANAPESKLVEAAEKRVKALRPCMGLVDMVKGAKPITPAELEGLSNKLAVATDAVKALLSPTQSGVVEAAQQALLEHAAEEGKRALTWLEELEKECIEGAALGALEPRLSRQPPFLAEEMMPRLQAVRKHVREKLDQDEVHQVREHFKRITDPGQRRACVDQLLKLVEGSAD